MGNFVIDKGESGKKYGDDVKSLREEIKVDTNDLLNPRVCQGKQLIPNILQQLGANEDIVSNPRVAETLRCSCCDMLYMRGYTNLRDLEGQYTENEINLIYKALQKCLIIPGVTLDIEKVDEVTRKYGFINKDTHSYRYQGISIDKETGNIRVQHLDGVSPDGLKNVSISEQEYSLDAEGNVVSNSEYRNVNENDSRIISTQKVTINRDGVFLKAEDYNFYKKDGIIENDKSRLIIRDSEYPLIMSVEKFNAGEKESSYYYPVRISDLDTMLPINEKDKKSGKIESVRFEKREEAVAYCEENKDGIITEIGKNSRYKNGIRKIAMKAGIISKEQEV